MQKLQQSLHKISASAQRINRKKTATYHNIYFLQKLIEKAKEKIRRGKFKEFLKEVEERYKEN